MAETPEERKRVEDRRSRLDQRNADRRYYASGQASVFGMQAAADGTVVPGTGTPPARPKPRRPDDRSTDKYYANNGSRTPGTPAAAARPASVRLTPVPRPSPRAAPTRDVLVETVDDVRGAADEVAARLLGGEAPVVVRVKAGERDLLRRTRAALEMLVTREVITEDQGRDVRLSYAPAEAERQAVDAVLGPPVPRGEAPPERPIGDPLDFLNAPDGPPPVDVAPVVPTEVDVSGDVRTSAEPDDDGDNTFLDPARESQVVTPADVGPVPDGLLRDSHDELDRQVETDKPVPPKPPEPRRPGRRSGRGTS